MILLLNCSRVSPTCRRLGTKADMSDGCRPKRLGSWSFAFFFFAFFCELWIADAEAVRAYLYSSSYTPSSIPPISILFPLSSTFYIFLSIIYPLSSVYPLSISSIVCRLFLISSFWPLLELWALFYPTSFFFYQRAFLLSPPAVGCWSPIPNNPISIY